MYVRNELILTRQKPVDFNDRPFWSDSVDYQTDAEYNFVIISPESIQILSNGLFHQATENSHQDTEDCQINLFFHRFFLWLMHFHPLESEQGERSVLEQEKNIPENGIEKECGKKLAKSGRIYYFWFPIEGLREVVFDGITSSSPTVPGHDKCGFATFSHGAHKRLRVVCVGFDVFCVWLASHFSRTDFRSKPASGGMHRVSLWDWRALITTTEDDFWWNSFRWL